MPAPARRRKEERASSRKDECFASLKSASDGERMGVRERSQLRTAVANGLL
jgi:hypothetical protein